MNRHAAPAARALQRNGGLHTSPMAPPTRDQVCMSTRSSPSPSDRGNSPTPAPPASFAMSAAHSGASWALAPPRTTLFCLLSELCANAVIHTDSGNPGGTFTVRAQHAADDHVRGEVQDQGSEWPGDLPASATRPHGLYLLLALASAYGVERTGRAHLVWFRLDCRAGPSPLAARPKDST